MGGRIKKAVALLTAAAVWGSGVFAAAVTPDADRMENTQTEGAQTENTQTEGTQTEGTQTGDMPEEPEIPAGGAEGVSCYLDMKMNEGLLEIYDETGDLLDEKEKICQSMYEEGETTELYAKQAGAEAADIRAKKQACTNEIRYDQYVLGEKNLDYSGIRVEGDKTLGTIESCTARYPDLDKFLVAGCVTDCENARAGIRAGEAGMAYLEEAYRNTVLLQEAGEASRLDVIDSRLAVLEAGRQLQALYHEMNVAYYTVVYGAGK